MRYGSGREALRGVDFDLRAGELAIVLGSNGSGKSTLLRCIVRLLTPTGGHVRVAGRDLARLSGSGLREARTRCAMIFQQPALVQRRSALANVATGSLGRHRDLKTKLGLLPRDELQTAAECLRGIGLSDFASQRAGTLSGGQQQRVAIARALLQRPLLLLADEPVASLDPEAAREIMALLRRLACEDGLGVLCVLHQPELALAYGHRVIGLKDGRVLFDLPAESVPAKRVTALYMAA
ncbi:MAG: ATP-binding cassette domain-containing protein [Alphaproteobacteria bacterium]|nr:ATP-binding cassette domain-containing protein [Alphaproteobacteria bacterium]